jgi:hypothetical protein
MLSHQIDRLQLGNISYLKRVLSLRSLLRIGRSCLLPTIGNPAGARMNSERRADGAGRGDIGAPELSLAGALSRRGRREFGSAPHCCLHRTRGDRVGEIEPLRRQRISGRKSPANSACGCLRLAGFFAGWG